ncbi:MAG: hypothetical protein COV55_02795 [Candidatus Komeilibacteria bacterium CG11_big_fil_rev_8_21_14_0_20_36_20]|uniref:Uncharacterized protein n=1 Tax=Candidatus Komeilibacteria bacterium CG11_big_fil_rev_8_21_14_0_20_36_20 TaxID=1974477 RepID=A0A2H0NCN6_9BACT|nr:MAG: hypothetical protein COV55_02795 [Candidatus Komeilibacteria bacterium CG11_big_fil_rev_8_21_14_0_20_36_20]
MRKKDKLQLETWCKKYGLEILPYRKHIKLKHIKTNRKIIISSSASCPFYMQHVLKDIKRLNK